MNKKTVNANLDKAYKAIEDVGIAKNSDTVKKTFRGQISTFGSAVTTGSLLTAIAFFSDKGGASVDRTLLMKAIVHVIGIDKCKGKDDPKNLYDYVKREIENNHEKAVKEEIINAAIAIKLAMNLYKLD